MRERFFAKVDATGDCHLWTAAVHKKTGYGKFSVSRSRWRGAHVVAWFLATGEWPTAQVLHRCDVRACVNPDHLYLGTHADNMRDRATRGRTARGQRTGHARLTERAVLAIRASSETEVILAERFGVSQATINRARQRRTWAWLADPQPAADAA